MHKSKETSKDPVGYPRPTWWVDMLTENDEEKEAEKSEE